MKKDGIQGLRHFLLIVLKLVSAGKKEKCNEIEEDISKNGIATVLTTKYKQQFETYSFNKDNIKGIDDYYRNNWSGVSEGNETKYFCDENDGLQLVIALALNDIF